MISGEKGPWTSAARRIGVTASRSSARWCTKRSSRSASGRSGGTGSTQHRDPVDEALGHRGVQRLEVVEVLEHAAHRHLRPLGDAWRGGPQVALLEQADGGVDDRLAGAERAQGAAVGGRSFLHDACRIRQRRRSGLGRHRRAVVGDEPPAGRPCARTR